MKKRFCFIFIVLLLLTVLPTFGNSIVKAEAVVKHGKISFYNPVNKGSDGKLMTENDCAVDRSHSYLPKGTKISATNLDTNKSKWLEKWDIGDFSKYGVVLDVLPETFVYLGGIKKDGYIERARIEWYDLRGSVENPEATDMDPQ
ncbi:septal ring lytic transglycosylase RlpA family protein [Sporosarcina cyprini]|uniref:septal ring lytic transglycosylase RlpA family protein n=1 Tax=Sporosarcina cyprini TaxID=2910523 RepID=UPI001EDEA8F7|nr:septal ring lytic transglycosylase RlpA family protein [Sporosarcina cyprini]MCG3086838.1 septal ring lytic transglycosylase RlpA family protein [Sporosarcina cyprini]